MDFEVPLPFFVYGTLRAGEVNAKRLHPYAVCVRPARLLGALLFDLGPYPMLLDSSPNQETRFCVLGELVAVSPTRHQATLHALDQLEGVNPRHPDSPWRPYRRVVREVQIEDGGMARAWVYMGREDLARRGRPIFHGDWKRRFQIQDSEASRGI